LHHALVDLEGERILIEQLSGFSPALFALACAMTFSAALIRGLTGFGMAIILVPLLGMIMRPDEAVVLAIVLQLLIGPVGFKKIFRDSDRPSVTTIAIAAVVTTPIGVWLLAQTPADVARVLIAAIAGGAFILVVATRKAIARPSRPASLVAGAAAGVLTGFAAMPGPPVVPYYVREAFSPVTARASMMAVFFATALAGTASVWMLGMLPWRLVILGLLLFVPMVIGNAIGGKGFGLVPAPVWRSGVAILLGLAGVSAIWRAFG
jgi:uncharacterized protein